jgi:hypothetical protein
MSESLGDLLAGKKMNQPAEIAIIQDFVEKRFHSKPEVMVQEKQVLISVRGAALAGALQPHLSELKDICQTDKRLVIRIQ